MPNQLLERYDAALNDPAILELTAEVALVDTRLGQLTERLSDGNHPQLRGRIETIRNNWPRLNSDTEIIRTNAERAISQALDVPQSDYAAWDELLGLIDQRRRLVESERKRRLESHTALTVEEAVNLSTALANLALQYISDPELQERYTTDVYRIFQLNRVPAGALSEQLRDEDPAISNARG